MQPDRKVLIERCYNAAGAVNDAHNKELGALERAWNLLGGMRDSVSDAQALGEARAFIAARRERYALLKDVTVPASPTIAMSCEMADDVMELEEGAPQWIASITTARAGVASAQVGRGNEPFYASGSWQLWIIERLIGAEAMRALTREIARSAQPSGPDGAIFGRFASVIGAR
jgi:hypothetical protein